jgi:hypothetical protein
LESGIKIYQKLLQSGKFGMYCIICRKNNSPITHLRNNSFIHENCLQLNYENEKLELRNKIKT